MAQIIQWSFRVVSQKERSEQTCFGPAEIAPNGIELFVRLCYRQTHRNKSAATLFLSAATAALILLYFFEFPFCFKWLFVVCLFLWVSALPYFIEHIVAWLHDDPFKHVFPCTFFFKSPNKQKSCISGWWVRTEHVRVGRPRNLQLYKETGDLAVAGAAGLPSPIKSINQSINYFAAKTRLI